VRLPDKHEVNAPEMRPGRRLFAGQALARLVRHAFRARRWYSARRALARFVRHALCARR
jgi:hypothetical protein